MAKARKVSTKRKYNNDLRLKKSEQVSKRVIQTMVELLVETRGGEVQFKDLAKKSKVPLRTIFRLFKDRDQLHKATEKYLAQIIQASVGELSKYDFITFSKNTFELYDKNENLVMAYLFSPFGHQARDILRKKFNQLLITQILKERKISSNDVSKKKMALIVSMVSAKIWYDIKMDFGYSGKESGEAVGWALQVLLENLEKNN